MKNPKKMMVNVQVKASPEIVTKLACDYDGLLDTFSDDNLYFRFTKYANAIHFIKDIKKLSFVESAISEEL